MGVNSGLVGRRVTRQGNGRLEGFAGGFFPDHEEAANTQINPVRVRVCVCVSVLIEMRKQTHMCMNRHTHALTHALAKRQVSTHRYLRPVAGSLLRDVT